MLGDHRNERELVRARRGLDAERDLSGAVADGGGGRHVGAFFTLVAVDIRGAQSATVEQRIEQQAGSGTGFPIDEPQAQTRNVLDAANSARVGLSRHQSLMSRQQPRYVVLSGVQSACEL